MALAIDGSATGTWSSGSTVVSGTLTTTNATDVIVMVVHTEAPASTITVSSISQPTNVGTWTKRKALTFNNTIDHNLEVWWAATTGTVSGTITVTLSATPDDACINVFGVSGANTSSPWDSSSTSPTNHGTTGAASVSGLTTGNANDMLLGFMGWGDTGTNPGNNTAGAMAGTTGTLIQSVDTASGIVCASEQRVVSATQSSVSIAFGSSSTVEWLMIADAIVAASAGATTPFGGWFFEPPEITQVTEAIGY